MGILTSNFLKGLRFPFEQPSRLATICRASFQERRAGTSTRSKEVPQMPSCDFQPSDYKGPSIDESIAIRKKHLFPSTNGFAYYKKPVMIYEGHMQWLWESSGKRFLDLFGGILTVSVGHCHPKVVKAAEEQMNRLWHTTSIYLNPALQEYAAKLASKMPGDLKVVYLVNSGSEANDLAMHLARLHTGCYDIIGLRSGYHGMSPNLMGLTALSTWHFNVPSGFGIHQTINPDPYRGVWGGKHCRDSPCQTDRTCSCNSAKECVASDQYIEQLEDVLRYCCPKGRVGGFFAESVQGVGGTIQFPQTFLQRAFKLVREHGGVCISDEVQTGFGRTGSNYWGFEGHGALPDIVTAAKGIGNGFPMAAVITTPEIAKSLSAALHFNTFGGNPLACRVGSAVLDVIEEDGCQKTSAQVGTYFLKELSKMRDEYSVIGDVRGKGLMIGVDMVADKKSRKPLAALEMAAIWEMVKDLGVLIGKGGYFGNVFRIAPPMCITKEDVDYAVKVFRIAMDTYQI